MQDRPLELAPLVGDEHAHLGQVSATVKRLVQHRRGLLHNRQPVLEVEPLDALVEPGVEGEGEARVGVAFRLELELAGGPTVAA